MKLKAWREEKGRSLKSVADELGTDIATVFRWEVEPGEPNRRIPNEGYMCGLYRLTGGAVTPNDFYDLPDLSPELPLAPPEQLPMFPSTGSGQAPLPIAPAGAEPERQAA